MRNKLEKCMNVKQHLPYSTLLLDTPRKHLVTPPGLSDPVVLRHGFYRLLWNWNVFPHCLPWHFVCCVRSDEGRGLANCSATWRRKTWRYSTKGERRRWYASSSFHFSANVRICAFQLIRVHPLFSFYRLGAAGLQTVSLAAGPGGPWGAVYGGLPSPAALLDARVVRQIHLHSYHSSWCWSGIAALHSKLHIELLLLIDFLNQWEINPSILG